MVVKADYNPCFPLITTKIAGKKDCLKILKINKSRRKGAKSGCTWWALFSIFFLFASLQSGAPHRQNISSGCEQG